MTPVELSSSEVVVATIHFVSRSSLVKDIHKQMSIQQVCILKCGIQSWNTEQILNVTLTNPLARSLLVEICLNSELATPSGCLYFPPIEWEAGWVNMGEFVPSLCWIHWVQEYDLWGL